MHLTRTGAERGARARSTAGCTSGPPCRAPRCRPPRPRRHGPPAGTRSSIVAVRGPDGGDDPTATTQPGCSLVDPRGRPRRARPPLRPPPRSSPARAPGPRAVSPSAHRPGRSSGSPRAAARHRGRPPPRARSQRTWSVGPLAAALDDVCSIEPPSRTDAGSSGRAGGRPPRGHPGGAPRPPWRKPPLCSTFGARRDRDAERIPERRS